MSKRTIIISCAVGLLVAAIAFVLYQKNIDAIEADKIRRTAIDGTVQTSIETRDSYNELLMQRASYRIDDLNSAGKISGFQAAQMKTEIKYMTSLDSINKYIDTYAK